MLRMLGLNVISFTSDLTPSERGRLLGSFNDKAVPVNALVVPSTMMLSGMNMHQACNWGIMIGMDESSAKVKQAFARLSRIGQTKEVFWDVIVMRGSHMRTQERACHTKEMNTISVMSPIPTEITTDVRTMMCYQVAREQFGAVMSFYTVSKHHMKITSANSYEEAWVERFSVFYTMVATVALREIKPTGDDVTDKVNLVRLCKRLQRLEDVFPTLCMKIEKMNNGVIDEMLTFALECSWDLLEEDIEHVEGEMRSKQDPNEVFKKYAFDLAVIQCGSRKDAKVTDPDVKVKYNEALVLQDISFQAPAVPEIKPEEPPLEDQAMKPGLYEKKYSASSWRELEGASDPLGFYDLLNGQVTSSSRSLFIAYAEERERLSMLAADDSEDEEAAGELDRLDEAASILLDAM